MNLANIYFNKMNKKKKTTLIQREGDWICDKCKNLNFKFRVECNLCKTPKEPKNKEEKIIEDNKIIEDAIKKEKDENKKYYKTKKKYNYNYKNYRNAKKRDDYF